MYAPIQKKEIYMMLLMSTKSTFRNEMWQEEPHYKSSFYWKTLRSLLQLEMALFETKLTSSIRA